MPEGRLPLTILGGFLGSDKTIWLRHQIRHGLAAHVIVNEAAGLPVDDALLQAARGVTVLSGGCACCEGRSALLAALRHLADRRSAAEVVADLVLETSGLADPAAIMDTIAQDPVLVHHIRPTGTIVLVDAPNAMAGARVSALALAQVRAADRLIVTKADRVAPEVVAQLAATLQGLNPLARISASVAGRATRSRRLIFYLWR